MQKIREQDLAAMVDLLGEAQELMEYIDAECARPNSDAIDAINNVRGLIQPIRKRLAAWEPK
jgi:hypothetical protein